MVRAGMVLHPSEWPHAGYNEIQRPKRKNVIVAYDRLRQLAGFNDYDAFATAHRQWIQSSMGFNDLKRDSRWTQSIAVGDSQFTERIKNIMGAMAKGRSIRPNSDGFELRESQTAYNSIIEPENRDIDP